VSTKTRDRPVPTNTDPCPGFCLVAGVVTPRRGRRHPATTTTTQHAFHHAHDPVVTGLGVRTPPSTLGNTDPRPGLRRVVAVVKPRRSRRHSAPKTVTPARAARHTRTPMGLHPDARHPAFGRLAPPPTPTRLRGHAYAQAPIGPAAQSARHTRPRVRGRTVATDDGEPPPPPNREWAARLQRLPPPGRLRPRGPVRGRDRPIGLHHPRISPERFKSRVGGM